MEIKSTEDGLSISALPQEVLVEVLERLETLPALLRAREVSTSWLAACSVRFDRIRGLFMEYMSELTAIILCIIAESSIGPEINLLFSFGRF